MHQHTLDLTTTVALQKVSRSSNFQLCSRQNSAHVLADVRVEREMSLDDWCFDLFRKCRASVAQAKVTVAITGLSCAMERSGRKAMWVVPYSARDFLFVGSY